MSPNLEQASRNVDKDFTIPSLPVQMPSCLIFMVLETKEMEPVVDYLVGDGPPPSFLYFRTFLFVRTLRGGGETVSFSCQLTNISDFKL